MGDTKDKLSPRLIQKRKARKLQAQAFKDAKEMGLDTAGMGYFAVQAMVAEAQGAIDPAEDVDDVTVDLDKLKKAELEKVMTFLELDLASVKNNGDRVDAIRTSDAWPEDGDAQAAIVSAIE